MNLLITGGAGFIGTNFVKWLLKNKPTLNLTVLDNLTYAGNLANLESELESHSQRLKFVKGSILDAPLAEKLIATSDGVFNFAAESHVDRSIDGPKVFVETNINGVFNLLEATRKSGRKIRFLQVSTDEVYGSLGETGTFYEDTPLAPNSPYSASKASADMLVRSYFHTFHMDVVTTRCSNNYGPYQFPEKLIPLMISNAHDSKKLPVYGTGLNVRDWIYVDDHCAGVWAAFEKGRSGEVYNFGGNTELPNLSVVKTILKMLDKPESLIEFVKDRPGHDLRYSMNFDKSTRELGWKPEMRFEEGLQLTVDWYMANWTWVDLVKSGDYRAFYERWYKK